MQLPGNRFPFNCMTSHWDEEEKIFYGYMRILIDPSRYANKFFNQVLEIMGHQPKGGIIYEEGAITSKQANQFQENYTKPGTSQEVAPGAISQGKIKDKPVPQLPAASMAVMEFCIKTMENVSGFSPESAWGQSGANVPGITNKQRQRASLLLLSKEFSSLSLYRIEEGEIIFEQLKTLSDDRLIRVGKPFESEVIRLAREPFLLKYSLNLDDTEREELRVLLEQVRADLGAGEADREGLAEQLEESAVRFESDHPTVAAVIRSAVHTLTGYGI